jgi:hypothetical protein
MSYPSFMSCHINSRSSVARLVRPCREGLGCSLSSMFARFAQMWLTWISGLILPTDDDIRKSQISDYNQEEELGVRQGLLERFLNENRFRKDRYSS